MKALESDLKTLPEPEPPPGLAAGISSRIARLEDESASGAKPGPAAVAQVRRDGLAWALIPLGWIVGLGAQTYSLMVALDLPPRIGGKMGQVMEMLPFSPAVLVLTAGLGLYLTGLFAPLRHRPRPRPIPSSGP